MVLKPTVGFEDYPPSGQTTTIHKQCAIVQRTQKAARARATGVAKCASNNCFRKIGRGSADAKRAW